MDYKSLAVIVGITAVVSLVVMYAVNHVDSLNDLITD